MNHRNHKIQPQMTVTALLLVMAFFWGAGAAAANLDGNETRQLESLEKKYFEHTYPKDTDTARIERVEEMVFGEAKSGDDETRLAALIAAGPSRDMSEDSPATQASSDDGFSGNAADANEAGTGGNASDGAGSTAQNQPSEGDMTDYPRVDAIEQVVLGKTFKGQPISRRLDQLEIKAFHKASTDPDLSNRTDNLEEFVEKHYHKSVEAMTDPRSQMQYASPVANAGGNYRAPAYTNSQYGGQPPSGSYGMPQNYGGYGGSTAGGAAPGDQPPPANAPEAQQLAWLETNVFGQTDPNIPLMDRIRKLDLAVFPSETPDPHTSIPMQISVLINAVTLMHHQQGAAQTNSAAGYGQQAPTNNYASNGPNGQFPSWPPASNSTQTGWANQNAGYGGADQYSQPGSQPFSGQQSQQPDMNQQYQQQQKQAAANQQQEKHGHPLLKSLARSLMTAGTMAAGSMMMGGMGGGYGGGYGGMGGMNMMSGMGSGFRW